MLETGDTHVKQPPRRVSLAHDPTTNTSCPSRGIDIIALGREASDRLDHAVIARYTRFLTPVESVTLGEVGEPFASRHMMNFLKIYCREKSRRRDLHLHSNGLLLGEDVWNRLNLWQHVSSVHVHPGPSMTHSSCPRASAQLKRLLPNLHFLGHLARLKLIDELVLILPISRETVTEIPDFVRMVRHLGASRIRLARPERCEGDQDICDPAHPDHEALTSLLGQPLLQAADIDITDLAELVSAPALEVT